jgi:signal transduction histidine kinase
MQDAVNILLVDDQPSKLLSYELILQELGETLVKSGSAREALGTLLKNDVALILIDVCMPDLDGFELAAIIRDHPRYSKIPIIFVSAIQVTDLDRLRGYEAGAVDYVPVPIVPEMLRAKVKVFAELHRKTRALERMNEDLERRVSERTAALEASSRELRELNLGLERRIEERTQEREAALAQLFEAQKIETIGQLTGGIAHDFNNLLMAVMGSLELLAKRVPKDPRTVRLLNTAMQGAERGSALTQRLLAFARRQELRPQAVDVSRLVAGMEDLLAKAAGSSVQITMRFAPGLPLAQVDGNQLELALLNVAVNARDAMPAGGTLMICGSKEDVLDAGNRDLRSGEYVCLRVTDTGQGMDEKTLAKASEPFFTTKGVGKGTGLGLSMVHGLAAQSGGALKISSEPGRGTTIEIWLPSAGERPSQAEKTLDDLGSAAQPRLPTCSVLLVDDDSLVSAGTAAMLEDLGHVVQEVSTAAEALRALEAAPLPGLVITDHAMPGMTGLALAREIRVRYPGLPVIIASGYAELPADNDASGFLRLSKPFRQSELMSMMSAVLTIAPDNNVVGLPPPNNSSHERSSDTTVPRGSVSMGAHFGGSLPAGCGPNPSESFERIGQGGLDPAPQAATVGGEPPHE